MKELTQQLLAYCRRLPADKAAAVDAHVLDSLYSVYPFNKFEYIISNLIAGGVMTLDDYLTVRSDYINRNRYLYLYELAPRTFGETWGQRHLMELVPEFAVPQRRLDPTFSGEYDLWLDGIKVEVKASRAVRRQAGDNLAEKALPRGTTEQFDMNFQQLKPDCCDVFVWIAVWRDQIDYWIIPSDAVKSNPHFSNQHRASRLTDAGDVVEGQIHIKKANYHDFEPYRARPDEIRQRILGLRAEGKI